MDQVNETRKCHTGRLTGTVDTQHATAPQLPFDGDAEGELEVVVLVDERCVLAADVDRFGPDGRAEEFICPDLPPASNAFLIVAAKLPFAICRRDETLPGMPSKENKVTYHGPRRHPTA